MTGCDGVAARLKTSATAIPVSPNSMNYASVVFAGFSFIAIVWYAVYARKHYKGPIPSAVRAKEAEAEASAVPTVVPSHSVKEL